MASSVSLSRKTACVQCSTWQVIKSLKTAAVLQGSSVKTYHRSSERVKKVHIDSYFREILAEMRWTRIEQKVT